MSTTKQVTILIAEDHLIARMGLKMLLQETSTFSVVGEAEDGASAVEKALELKPDVVIMDLDMPKMGGIEATTLLKEKLPATKVLIFTTMGDDEAIFAALKAGANGYCLKTISGDMLEIAIRSVMNGAAWLDPSIAGRVLNAQANPQVENKPDLSGSKLRLLGLIEEGKSVDQIASELSVNDSMVKGLLNELLNQLRGPAAPDGTVIAKESPVTSIRPGEVIAGHYHLDELIGKGGMGCVYGATDTHLDRKVAIKTMHEIDTHGDAGAKRFKTEAKANAAITHQNLATIYEFGLLNDCIPYLVMEFLDGKSLGDYLDQDKILEKDRFVEVFAQICDALNAVHSKGIVHRDLKPSNIMLITNPDNSLTVKLVDFGIAKVLAGAGHTGTGEMLGTPYYMSPEQVSAGSIDQRSDLYSLGCTMYDALTGAPPFTDGSPMEICLWHVLKAADDKPLKAHNVPENISSLVMSLLQKRPEDRPSSALEVRKLLLKV